MEAGKDRTASGENQRQLEEPGALCHGSLEVGSFASFHSHCVRIRPWSL